MQGVNKKDVTLPFVFSIKYQPTNTVATASAKILTVKQTITSDEDGKFRSQRIALTDIKEGEVKDNQIQVFVKTNTSLRKKLGTATLTSATNNLITLNTQIIL